MYATEALDAMADAMTAVNAGRWQVTGVSRWQDMAGLEMSAAISAGGTPAIVRGGVWPGIHAGWMALARQVITAMYAQSSAACAAAEKAREDARRILADRERLLAAGILNPGDHLRAGRLLRAARKAGEKAAACDVWAPVALDAAAHGVVLTRRAGEVHAPVGAAIAAAGPGWVPRHKSFSTAGS